MKKVSSIIASTALMISLAAASYAAPAKKPAKKNPVKEWTFAVFLNCDNNLDRFGVEDQEEMARIGSNENLNVVTLIDRERGPAQINYIEKVTSRRLKTWAKWTWAIIKNSLSSPNSLKKIILPNII